MKKSYEERLKDLNAKGFAYSKAKDTTGVKKITEQIYAIQNEIKEEVYKPFILANAKSSPVVLNVLSDYIDFGNINVNEVESMFQRLASGYKLLPSGKILKEKIEEAKKTDIGAIAPGFTQNDTLGNPVSLSSLRGKYVLLDFWASWCVPCRDENPNLVKVYKQFHDRNFEIMGISLDMQKNPWVKAIQKDGLPWIHVSDLLGFKNAVALQYHIIAIPQNFLIDPNGKIIARNLRGEELIAKLGEIFR